MTGMLRLQAFPDERLPPERIGLPAAAIGRLELEPEELLAVSGEPPQAARLGPVAWEPDAGLGPDGCSLAPEAFPELGIAPGDSVLLRSVRVPQPWFWTFFWECQEEQGPARAEDILILLDTSGSMAGRPLSSAKRALHAFLARREELDRRGGGTQQGDRIGLLSFSGEGPAGVRLWHPLNRERRIRFTEALQEVRANGSTPMAEAVVRALEIFGELGPPLPERRRRILLISDGRPCPGHGAEVAARLPELAAAGIQVVAVGVGESFDRELLGKLAAGTRGSFIEVQRIRELLLSLEELA